MAIKHKKSSAKTDGTDAALVQPSDWNNDHDIGVSFTLGTFTQRLIVPNSATITTVELGDIVSTLIKALGPAAAFDADAQTFFTAASITDNTQKTAVNQLVIDLKAAGAWTKLKAIYPFVGGTAAQHSFNLKATASHQMTWFGTVTHNANGVTGNGTTGYGDTNFNQSTNGALNSEYVSVYSRSDITGDMFEFGVLDGSFAGTYLIIKNSANQFESRFQSTGSDVVANAISAGYQSISRIVSTQYLRNRNGTQETVVSARDAALVNGIFFFMARNANGTAQFFSTRNYAFAAIGAGLTATEDAAVRTAVVNFETSLARNI